MLYPFHFSIMLARNYTINLVFVLPQNLIKKSQINDNNIINVSLLSIPQNTVQTLWDMN